MNSWLQLHFFLGKPYHLFHMSGVDIDLGANSVAICGAGLVGCLLGVYLRQHNYQVSIFESRQDPRLVADAGRSINLVITSRGIAALTGVSESLAAKVMAVTVPVFGRHLHSVAGELTYQAYGPDASYCNFSVSRWELNTVLISAAEEAGCKMYFSHPLSHLDVPNGIMYFYLQNPQTTQLFQRSVKAAHVFGADGGGSKCRQALKGFLREAASDVAQPLRYGYKELFMPKNSNASMESLHIWPRGSHFMMALPNKDGSFTVTLYMQETGPISFAEISTPDKVRKYFEQYYPDAITLMPNFVQEYVKNPVGFLGTVFAAPWAYSDKLALIGDAAHAITPFFGQGCNCGFEDVAVFNGLLTKAKKSGKVDMKKVFEEYSRVRKPNGDAIANMALENFTEMMSKTADKKFLLEKDIELELCKRFPKHYVSRYALVTHSLVPYHLCRQIGDLQQKLLSQLSQNVNSADSVNYDQALKLIQSQLTPFMEKHKITPDMYNYTSKYYPKPKSQAKL